MEKNLDQFITYLLVERNASPYTARNYRREVGEFLRFRKGEGVSSLQEIDRQVLTRYLLWLRAKGYVKASIRRRISELRSFFRYLVGQKIVESNPIEAISAPKVPQRLPRYLKPEEIGAIMQAPDTSQPLGQRNRAILEILYATGMRISELTGLDVGTGKITRGEMMVRGKGGKDRIVLLGRPAREALDLYLKEGRPRLLKGRRTSALFLNRSGERLSVRGVQSMLDRCAKKAGLSWVTPHLFRHTFATHMLGGGADLRVVQELLGHVSLSSTQVYTHVSQRRAREVYMHSHPLAREGKAEGR
ncbi:MAG: tyrosine recombinase XerC [Anaerolineae bacterium]|nr:tyrosine recombinase XerC [Anaerolineae bacterium]